MGFKFPMARWFKEPLADFITKALGQGKVFDDGLFNKDYVDRILTEHQSGRVDHNFKIWHLLNYEIWYRLFIAGDTRADTREWLADLLGSYRRAA